MERMNVKSSNVASVGYNETQKIMEIEFHSGGIYQYLNVEKTTYLELMKASSKGKYFHNHILNKYPTKKIS